MSSYIQDAMTFGSNIASSVAFSYAKDISAKLLQAKEHYYQYTELIKDAERALDYEHTLNGLIIFLENNAEKNELCNFDKFKKTVREYSEFLKQLKDDSSIRKALDEQQKALNKAVEAVKDIKDPSKISKGIQDKISGLLNQSFVKMWPDWYRHELNSQINRVNVALDDIFFNVTLLKHKKKSCAKPKSLRIKVDKPIEIDEDDLDVFEDAIEYIDADLPQQGGSRRKQSSLNKRLSTKKHRSQNKVKRISGSRKRD